MPLKQLASSLFLGCVLMAGPAIGELLSASPQASQAPLTKEQVLGLVRNQLGDETGARAIRERGIDFEPAEDFLGALKSVGASDAFIAALKAAFEALRTARRPAAEQPGTPPKAPAAPPPGPSPSSQAPMDDVQVLDLMINKIPSARMAALVKERGITFEPDVFTLSILDSLGARNELLPALRAARVFPKDEAAEKSHAQLAEADYAEKLQHNPRNHIVRTALAFARETQGKKDGNVELFREGVRLEPNDAWSHTMLGFALIDGGDEKEADREFRTAIRLQPSSFFAHFLLGLVLVHREQDWKASLGEYREAARLKPDMAEAHVEIGKILSENLKDHDGAVQELQLATRLDPKDGQAFLSLGQELMNFKDNPAEAIEPLRTACQLSPQYAFYHQTYGEALVKNGDKVAAWEEYRKAHELSPENQEIRTNFEALSKELGK